ncbi:unnamed protein product [marine sediment metagenome]|uniref:Uncharacterized protein n=1 Tax=marine sediment metagenome TaxID=412755 RepID=X1UE74_9ZZZZ
MKELWTFIRHNQGMFIGGAIAAIVLIWAYGCESQVKSIVNPIVSVNRGELKAEVNNFIALAELRFADLDRQDETKKALFDIAIDFMQGGKINPAAVALTLGNILGLGAIIDNARKRTHIATLKGNAAASPPQA